MPNPDIPPATPATLGHAPARIDQWKSRLLDLSLRNRLLNFRETRTTLRILSQSPAHMEDELTSDRELALRPQPELTATTGPEQAAALEKYLHEALALRRCLHTDLAAAAHTSRLTELYRATRGSLEESGANTLFAAIGILEWREGGHGERVLRAPLLLVPVELKRKSVLEGFFLRRLDEETRVNVTLLEMLRRDFKKEIHGLDPLPEDAKGVDVARVFQIFSDAVRDIAGWEVKAEVWLGQFSFTKFLLWKDLADRLDALMKNRVIGHLVNGSGTAYPRALDNVQPEQLDDSFAPHAVYCPRSADSSQLAAVMAAAAGHDFVLEGPPGTGKSQTITNIIAHCLAQGKRILFVAEKRAALDVVHRRLREDGLEPFCLELHSNKTGKTGVLAQFAEALKTTATHVGDEWERRAAELGKNRDALNVHARALKRHRACGLSAWDCLDYLLPRRDEAVVRLDAWPTPFPDTSPGALEHARELVRLLQERARPLAPLGWHALAPFTCEEWAPAWSEHVLECARRLAAAARELGTATRSLFDWLGIPGFSSRMLACAGELAEGLVDLPGPPAPAFVSTPWSRLGEDINTWFSLAAERAALREKLSAYDEEKLLAVDLPALDERWSKALHSWFLPGWFHAGKVRSQLRAVLRVSASSAVAALKDHEMVSAVLQAALRLRAVNAALAAAAPAARACLGRLWAGGEPAPDALDRIRARGLLFHACMDACSGGEAARLEHIRHRLAVLFDESPEAHEDCVAAWARLAAFRAARTVFKRAFDALAGTSGLRRGHLEDASDYPAAILAFAEGLPADWGQIREWCFWQKARNEAVRLGLAPLVAQLEAPPPDVPGQPDLPALFERSFRHALLDAIIEEDGALRGFFGREHEERITRFRELDEAALVLARDTLRTRLAAGVPRDGVSDASVPQAELTLLRKELAKKMRHLPVRQLLRRIPNLLPRLKPCVLMSPLSVAQYLEPSHALFDIVIFDEASQIAVWDAVGAIARGKQLIVVGDSKQLPPTNFFAASPGDDDAENADETVCEDLESILDDLLAGGFPRKRLQWHYRSRHESLIAFSNERYYDGGLLTFPAPDAQRGGVRFIHLPEARYDKGKTRTNRVEADALVAELMRRLRADGPPRSFGVVTFSLAQQQLIENLLDNERRKDPAIERHFGDESPVEGEPVFVKNLENVQGDERDVILFSICYGADESGKVSMNFGPLNREGGERRLNVAVTRAKRELLVFSGLRAGQVDTARVHAPGVDGLRQFLEYAERGGGTGLVMPRDAHEPDAGFVHMVAERIRAAGYAVHVRVGCSGYRVDLAVLAPLVSGRYLLGIECDGQSYQNAATARDRDKLRRDVLEGLGWQLHRIWAVDWWHDADGEAEKLLRVIAGYAARG
ncbi:MAG: DUF4011 domain-containing protein [Puniceicoccales bacterium]|jgi:very-short-patch-repair endonuclease|nr:DUF4011 domain-containing protein [Puniceicoccales bacterium]